MNLRVLFSGIWWNISYFTYCWLWFELAIMGIYKLVGNRCTSGSKSVFYPTGQRDCWCQIFRFLKSKTHSSIFGTRQKAVVAASFTYSLFDILWQDCFSPLLCIQAWRRTPYYLYPSSPRLSKTYSCVGAVHGEDLILNIELLQSPLIYEIIFHPQRQRHGQTDREVQLEELRKFWGFACRDGCNVGRRCTSVS